MARSLGLAAYRALARRGDVSDTAQSPPRPKGELVWIHAGEPGNLLAVQDLAQRLIQPREGLSVLITLPEGTAPPADIDISPTLFHATLPSDHPAAVTAFLDHWDPGVGVWLWGGFRPNLIFDATERGRTLILVDADSDGIDHRKSRWLPDLTRRVLTRFDAVFARSEAGYRRLLHLGLLPSQVQRSSPLLAGGQALSCRETDLAELAAAMGGRPAWYATNVLPAETGTVLSAHAQAMRLSHRLLLILQSTTEDGAKGATELASGKGLHVCQWDDGELPDETTQVLISADPSNRGLFYRMAPVSFLGSTLIPGNTAYDPLDAAALGSAILYGPKVRHFLPSYTRLAAAGAARIVNDADALGAAVTSLIAPDHAAAMAHAGWDVISQGAALTDKVIDLVQEALDTRASRK